MLNQNNYSTAQADVKGNFVKYLPMMAQFKSTIQREIIPMLTEKETNDIRLCRLNMETIGKLVVLGRQHWNSIQEKTPAAMYCLCMAIGTIIKEYDWGTKYIQQDGMCTISQEIVRQ